MTLKSAAASTIQPLAVGSDQTATPCKIDSDRRYQNRHRPTQIRERVVFLDSGPFLKGPLPRGAATNIGSRIPKCPHARNHDRELTGGYRPQLHRNDRRKHQHCIPIRRNPLRKKSQSDARSPQDRPNTKCPKLNSKATVSTTHSTHA